MTNHEVPSAPKPEFTPEEQAMLSIARVDEWRDLQDSTLLPVVEKAKGDEHYDQILSDTIGEGLKLFLEKYAITADTPHRNELIELYRAASVDKISDDEWLLRPSSRTFHQEADEDMSQQDIFAQKIAAIKEAAGGATPAPAAAPNPASKHLPAHPRSAAPASQSRPAPAPPAPLPPRGNQTPVPPEPFLRGEPNLEMDGFVEAEELNEKWNTKHAELTAAREKLAKLASKRQGKLFGRVSDEYLLAKQEYDDIAREFSKIQFADDRALFDQMDDEARQDFSRRAVDHVVNEQQKLRELTNENLQGTPVGKVVKWMQSGTKAQRVRRSIYLGAGSAVVGAAIPVALAGVGLAAGAGVTALGASRLSAFARGYASHDKRGMGELSDSHKKQLQDTLTSASRSSRGALFDGVRNQANMWYEYDSLSEQRQRRHAVGKALAIVGVGSMLGELAHLAADHGILHNPFAHHSSGNSHEVSSQALQHYGDTHTGSAHAPTPHATAPSHSGSGHHSSGTHHTETPQPQHGHSTGGGSSHGEMSSPSEHLSPAEAEKLREAAAIKPGEGFYEVFQKAGIPSDKWATILHQAGPELHQKGLAYFDHAHNEWRIGGSGWHSNFPNRMPASGMRVISQVAAKNGYKLAA